MEAFAASAATAVATAQEVAAQTLRRSIDSSERERARWARDLHDETLQELSALKIALSSGQRVADVEALRATIATAIEYSEHAIKGLREIISDLRPAALDALGTQAAIETLVERARVTLRPGNRMYGRPGVRVGPSRYTANPGARSRHLPNRPGSPQQRRQARSSVTRGDHAQ